MSNERERALEACPFCGSANVSRSMGKTGDGKDWPYVECEDCGASTEPDVWNRRALLASSPPPSCERMEDALHRIKQWADAYPVDVFRPISDEKLKEANEALKAIGVDMGALHAGWARHIVDGIGNIARAALDAAPSCEMRKALERLYRAYVSTLETGRNRIIDSGGTCDAVDIMEKGDPALVAARAALDASRTEEKS